MDAIKETLYSPTPQNGRRKPIHFQSEGSQIILAGLESFPDLDISENDTALSAIEKLARRKTSGAGVLNIPITIPKTGWTAAKNIEYNYYFDIANETITEETTPVVLFSAVNIQKAQRYGVGNNESLNGKLRIYAMEVPEEEIPASLCLFGSASSVPSGNLPLASKTRAGVVKIGDNIDVTSDGTISVPALSDADGNGIPDVIDGASATDEEVDEMLDEVYGKS